MDTDQPHNLKSIIPKKPLIMQFVLKISFNFQPTYPKTSLFFLPLFPLQLTNCKTNTYIYFKKWLNMFLLLHLTNEALNMFRAE